MEHFLDSWQVHSKFRTIADQQSHASRSIAAGNVLQLIVQIEFCLPYTLLFEGDSYFTKSSPRTGALTEQPMSHTFVQCKTGCGVLVAGDINCCCIELASTLLLLICNEHVAIGKKNAMPGCQLKLWCRSHLWRRPQWWRSRNPLAVSVWVAINSSELLSLVGSSSLARSTFKT